MKAYTRSARKLLSEEPQGTSVTMVTLVTTLILVTMVTFESQPATQEHGDICREDNRHPAITKVTDLDNSDVTGAIRKGQRLQNR
jgi:hypothetical protein